MKRDKNPSIQRYDFSAKYEELSRIRLQYYSRKRQQKVYYKHHDYEGGFFHPHIRIAGKYLKEFDFNVGDSIEVYLSKGKITIVKVEQPL